MAIAYSTDGGVIQMALADALTGPLYISHIIWVAAGSSIADGLLVTDTAGKTIVEGVADIANYTGVYPVGRKVEGLIVDTMASGNLYVYLEQRGK
jgi:hypothetical protein